MASSVRSFMATGLVVAVVMCTLGVATAHNGHHHGPAAAPKAAAPKAASASGLLPSSILANLVLGLIGFAAARYL
ncbi:hypothetical protein MPTK1_6g20590 [Marchantia polymorpha subsp. ruderalis]|uniref:Uncharacterized protein n=2 Tax=Marchantia polymorpha TaxID=3197 RepID=A0AAF6BU83_MARPO|nr:hypothetical protein MARPO_0045s0005 [Marchantia polymorpha]BBN15567.1 hypothetical protein Mp_6g20590 [Marchantia polymorpha subsp. ruderalis]|eukprot:PTQ39322.1 hypothetical protein MARPO_0045s0005 [Marchantia polymorpha]